MMASSNVATAYVQVVPTTKDFKNNLMQTMGADSESAGNASGGLFGKAMAKMAIVAVAAAGIGKAISASISEGAKMEQSIGGIETMFKGSADRMKQYAQNAYKTAGISANTYMEQATSFSASLLQSLGGDTEKAATVANMAITDMADNANKFGSNIQDIQNAYQGFAKQNYTMLDNLKLGYGGTKTEMQRLLKDATKLTGVKYDINNLNDVYNAIHAIQKDLDITGTTAKEAMTTMSGSFGMLKASWSTLLGNLALGQNVDSAMKGVVTSAVATLGNLIPAIGRIFASLPVAIGSSLQMVIPTLTSWLNSATSVLSKGIDFSKMKVPENIQKMANSIVSSTPKLLKAVTNLGKTLVTFTTNLIPQIFSQLINVIITQTPNLIRGFYTLLGNVLSSLQAYIPTAVSSLQNMIQKMLDSIKNVNWAQVVTNIGNALIDGLIVYLPRLASLGITLGTSLIKGLIAIIPQLPGITMRIVVGIIQGLGNLAIRLITVAGSAIKGFMGRFTSVNWGSIGIRILTGIVNSILGLPGKLLSLAGKAVSNFANRFKSFSWGSLGKRVLTGVYNAVTSLPSKFLSIATKVVSSFKNGLSPSKFVSIGKNVINGVISGIGSMVGKLYSSIKSALSGLVDKAKNALGIHSPSRVFRDEIGKWIPEGIAVGINGNTSELEKSMNNLKSISIDAMQSDFNLDTQSTFDTNNDYSNAFSEMIYLLNKLLNKDDDVVIQYDQREVARMLRKARI